MRSNGTRAAEWSDAEYAARKAKIEALKPKSMAGAIYGPKTGDGAPETLKTLFTEDEQ